MKNAPSVVLVLGKVFASIGLIGTALLLAAWFWLPPSHRHLVSSGIVFPIFLLLGSTFRVLGTRGTGSTQTIKEQGVAIAARPLRILKRFGRHPVSHNSIYALEVAFDADGRPMTSRAFFYGKDHRAIENLIAAGGPVQIIYCAEYPKRVLFAEAE
mgnify:CR=1 FL=1